MPAGFTQLPLSFFGLTINNTAVGRRTNAFAAARHHMSAEARNIRRSSSPIVCKTLSNGHFVDHRCDAAQAYAAFSILTIIKGL
jgi:hypothetical protein